MLACPQVEITGEGVRIGEDEKAARLSHAEWNQFVRLIKCDALGEV